jgi:hypothetical protein
MRKLVLKQVECVICGSLMMAKRVDRNRCKNCRAIYLREYRKKPEVRARRAKQHRALREEAFRGYGGACSCCGENTFEFLALDHVNGGGYKDRLVRATSQIARDVINRGFPPDFQVLCHNCNLAKGFFGSCPHQE